MRTHHPIPFCSLALDVDSPSIHRPVQALRSYLCFVPPRWPPSVYAWYEEARFVATNGLKQTAKDALEL